MEALQYYGSSSSSSSGEEADRCSTPPVERGTVLRRVDLSSVAEIRGQPHVNGNWAGHCYIRLRLSRRIQLQAAKQLDDLVDRLERAGYSGNCQSHLPDGDVSFAVLHLSLSRTFYLQAANLEPFLQALTKQLAHVAEFSLLLNTSCGSQLLLHNDEHTRSFLVWPVVQPLVSIHNDASPLVQLVRRIDACLAPYKIPPYYDPPVFHVSLASFVPAVSEDISNRLNNKIDDHGVDEKSSSSSSAADEDDDECGPQIVSAIHCTFGTTKHYTISLCQR